MANVSYDKYPYLTALIGEQSVLAELAKKLVNSAVTETGNHGDERA